MYKSCPEKKIYNPQSKRCVNVDGGKAKELWKKHVEGKIILQNEDVAKMTAFLENKKVKKAPGVKEPKGKKPVEETKLPSFLKNKLKQNLEKVKQANNFYVSDDHKKACQKNDMLSVGPVISNFVTVNIPYPHFEFAKKISSGKLQNVLKEQSKIFNIATRDATISLGYSNYNKLKTFETSVTAMSKYKENPAQMFGDIYDPEWFIEQNKYIASLSFEDLLTVHGYTINGDKVINLFLRQADWWYQLDYYIKHNFSRYFHNIYMPFAVQAIELIKQTDFKDYREIVDNPFVLVNSITVSVLMEGIRKHGNLLDKYNSLIHISKYIKKEFWQRVLEQYTKDLNRIIRGAPPVKKTMLVFRGVKDDYFLTGREGFTYKNKGFLSTSLSSKVANDFLGYETCCFKKITVLKGTRALIVIGTSYYPDEMEMLLATDSIYSLRRTYKIPKEEVAHAFSTYSKPSDIKKAICPTPKTFSQIQMTEVIIIK